ncbi:hypothetical protein Dimus_036970 [Dionaea muscipula]
MSGHIQPCSSSSSATTEYPNNLMMKLPLTFLFTILIVDFPSLSSTAAVADHNLVSYGGKPNGETDSSAAFLEAWNAACSSPARSTITVPAGRFFVNRPVLFSGGPYCKSKGITFRILGTLVAPPTIVS